jgi:colanic acid biosynthesis glycosyl transferase WcaI
MKCMVHDYAGHPFQVQLSRHLARRGHDVTHVYFADNPGPKGVFELGPDDPRSLTFIGVTLGGTTQHAAGTGAKTGFARRSGDIAHGREVARIIQRMSPDVVLSGNTPTEAQRTILRTCRAANVRFIYWLQDVYSMAVTRLMTKKLGMVGAAIGWYYRRLDRAQFRLSDAVVAISEDFVPLAASWGARKIRVIKNWAAIDDLPIGAKDNDWSRQHGLQAGFAYLYSGTLGRKHNPSLLLRLAHNCKSDASVVVVAQGYGMPQLQAAQSPAMKLLPIQPAQHLADVLATADVLVAMIEPDAGTIAVPSKVLSYLCAGRPILLAAPKGNLAARIVEHAIAGMVVDPADAAGFVAAALRLRDDPQLCAKLGANGRAYAERMFDMRQITDEFERVMSGQ